MLLHVLSDLHLEFSAWTPPTTAADVVLLAGDTHVGVAGVRWAAEAFAGKLVVYVPGNHEYYGEAFPQHLWALRRAAAGTSVRVLDRAVLELPALRVLGCTFWTDFGLNGDRPGAMRLAGEAMWDYRQIRILPRLRPARPVDTLRWHRRARAWLAAQLAKDGRPAVVVTHHAPSRNSTSAEAADRPYAPAYASDCDETLLAQGPALWVHGHIHRARDYRYGRARVICNPRGYPDQAVTGFVPDLLVEVP